MSSSTRLSVDIGGTFTDLVVLDEATGDIQSLKVSSTPRDPSRAVITAVRRARDELGVDLSRVSQFTHASTVASNTILEATGARTGLLTTEGFRDVLAIQRHKRYRLFEMAYQKIKPLVPARWIHGIPERMDAHGNVLVPLDEDAVVRALRELEKHDIQSLAVCFLFSFQNAAHEKRVAEIAAEVLPHVFVTCSSDIFPQFREYERTSTTVVNAYLGPRLSGYLQNMNTDLQGLGLAPSVNMMQSNGGIISWKEASRAPCKVVESGPAAGAIAAAHFGKLVGSSNIISFDMGGTTAKAGLIENGEVRQASGQEVGGGINVSRLLSGGGYYIGASTVDLAEVGAGGGSVAWIDTGGILKVGPHSAGADPGPVAYGLGGDRVTVTDANLVLGRVPGAFFLGGEMKMDVEAARRVAEEKLSRPLNVSLDEACSAMIEVANANMLKMLRIVSVEKGFDPREFTLVVFGGNGPVHAADLADDLGINEFIVPPVPGVLSAQGLLVADVRYDFRQTHITPVTAQSVVEIEDLFNALREKGRTAFRDYGLSEDAVKFSRSADMRYRRQAYEIKVSMPAGELTADKVDAIIEMFHVEHEKAYGRRDPTAVVEFVTLGLTARGNAPRPQYRPLPEGDGSLPPAMAGAPTVYFREVGRVETPHYDRKHLRAGDTIAGPALVISPDSTTVVPPRWTLRCHSNGSLIVTHERAKQ